MHQQDTQLAARKPADSGDATVIAVCNQKGGVGKTTSTCHLARALAQAGKRVLVIDLDPQGNTTSTLAQTAFPDDAIGVADVIAPKSTLTLADVILQSIWTGVDLAPTPNIGLSTVEVEIDSMRFGRETAVKNALEPQLGSYDAVIIDNTPALGLLLINALTAAYWALVVTQPEQWSADGLAELDQTIALVTQHHNPQLRTAGPLINGKRSTEQHDRIIRDEIVPFYEGSAWSAPDEVIPMWASVSDHLHAGLGLDQARAIKDRRLAEVYTKFGLRLLGQNDQTTTEVSA